MAIRRRLFCLLLSVLTRLSPVGMLRLNELRVYLPGYPAGWRSELQGAVEWSVRS